MMEITNGDDKPLRVITPNGLVLLDAKAGH